MSTGRDNRWEYRTVRPDRGVTMKELADPERTLNEFGKNGWEFVETIDYVGGGTKFLVFRRRRSDDRE